MPGLIKPILFILSLVYGLAVRFLSLYYRLRPCRLPCKVISVGNITLGGTGKTVLVEYIAQFLGQQGHKVAILSRGYKRKTTDYRLRTTDYETMGDEPYMLQKRLPNVPVIVDSDRIRGAQRAVSEFGADTVILDDGFQQWKIKEDLEIAAIDARNPFGNRRLLPRGILREPVSSLRRADVIVLTKLNLTAPALELKGYLQRLNPIALIIGSRHEPKGFYPFGNAEELLSPQSLQGKNVVVFSGIADPGSFEQLIRSLGMSIALSFRFSDHHEYSPAEIAEITRQARGKAVAAMITTEKDAARLRSLQLVTENREAPACRQAGKTENPRLYILRITLTFDEDDEQRLHTRLLRIYGI
ncbi:MAG: tetraacyldisaccharide 4'-kinase [Candidatus Omnitrophota bacterium]|nr:tetraacyldisaccharide 4'-kinase [Candidatus Omnitrophota bacterium]